MEPSASAIAAGVCQGTLEKCLGPNPIFHWIDANLPLAMILAFVGTGGLILTLLFVPMLRLLRRSGSAKLKTTGLRATGRVQRVIARNMRSNADLGAQGSQIVTIMLEVLRDGTASYAAETSLWVRIIDIPSIQVGSLFAVYIDPDRPYKVYIDLTDRIGFW